VPLGDHLNLDIMDEVEYVYIPICNGQATARHVSYARKGDWWYRAIYDDKGYPLLEVSSHPMLCGSKEVHYLFYDDGTLIYRKTDHSIRLVKHTGPPWEYIYYFERNSWLKRNYVRWSEWIEPSIHELQSLGRYIIPKLKKSFHAGDVDLVKEALGIIL